MSESTVMNQHILGGTGPGGGGWVGDGTLHMETGAQETTLDQAGSPFPGLTQASHSTVKMQGEARTLSDVI